MRRKADGAYGHLSEISPKDAGDVVGGVVFAFPVEGLSVLGGAVIRKQGIEKGYARGAVSRMPPVARACVWLSHLHERYLRSRWLRGVSRVVYKRG